MSKEMNGSVIYLVESFLEENYGFRRNLLNGKTEYAIIHPEEEDLVEGEEKEGSLEEEVGSTVKEPVKDDKESERQWKAFTSVDFSSIVRRAKKLGIAKDKHFLKLPSWGSFLPQLRQNAAPVRQ